MNGHEVVSTVALGSRMAPEQMQCVAVHGVVACARALAPYPALHARCGGVGGREREHDVDGKKFSLSLDCPIVLINDETFILFSVLNSYIGASIYLSIRF